MKHIRSSFSERKKKEKFVFRYELPILRKIVYVYVHSVIRHTSLIILPAKQNEERKAQTHLTAHAHLTLCLAANQLIANLTVLILLGVGKPNVSHK